MIPLTGTVAEMKLTREMTDRVAARWWRRPAGTCATRSAP